MAVTADSFDGASLGPHWTFDPGDPADCTHEVSGGVCAVTIPAGSTHDTIFSTSSPDNSPGIVQTIDDADLDVAVLIDTELANLRGQGGGILVFGDTDADTVRATIHCPDETASVYCYSRSGGTDATHVNATAVGFHDGHGAWLRLTRTGDTWAFYISSDGVNWVQQGSSWTRAFPVSRLKICAINVFESPGVTLRVNKVADLASTPDPRDPVGTTTATTVESTDFAAGLPTWLTDTSANSGAATVAGGVLTLSQQRDIDGSTGRVEYNGPTITNGGILLRARQMDDAGFFVAGILGDDTTWAGDQYVPGTGYLAEINVGSTFRALRVTDPIDASSFEDPYTWLSDDPFSPGLGEWFWVRIEYMKQRLRARWWPDGATEPDTWDFDGQDHIARDVGIPWLSYSHNDGDTTIQTVTTEVDSFEVYTLESTTRAFTASLGLTVGASAGQSKTIAAPSVLGLGVTAATGQTPTAQLAASPALTVVLAVQQTKTAHVPIRPAVLVDLAADLVKATHTQAALTLAVAVVAAWADTARPGRLTPGMVAAELLAGFEAARLEAGHGPDGG